MPLTTVQQGLIAQNDFAKFLMIGGGGLVEIAAPMTDDEGRDGEIHKRGEYSYGIAGQFKSTGHLSRRKGRPERLLEVRFSRPARLVVNDPRYWYFIGYLDLKQMGLADPVFVVPSAVFHKEARQKKVGDVVFFRFRANMDPSSKDKWQRYRVQTHQLGKRVLEIMADLEKEENRKRLLLSGPITGPGTMLLRKAT